MRNKRNKILKEKGITLVALVVTIVVLLILAGITINLILGPNSIFEMARKAKDETEQSVENEQKGMANLTNRLDEQGWGNSTGGSTDGGTEENPNPGGDTPTGPNGKPLVDAIEKNDTENQEVEDINGNPITIPAGYEVLANGEDGVEYNTDSTNHSPCVEDGIVIQDEVGNQFVWVPVNDEQYSKMIDETNMRGNLYNFSTSGTSPISYSATGFREPDSVTNYDNTSSNFINAGIKDKEGNDITNATTFKALLQEEFNEMVASVNKYKGFYIGRYETGNLEKVKDSTPVVQRGNTKIGNANWYYQYANIKNIAKNNDKVTSSMIWGCQWDRTLEWIVATNGNDWSLVTNSTDWGNYSGTTFEYTAEDGTTKTKSGSTIVPTGSSERNKKNNIYDMAGNVYDWTIEANVTNFRVSRRRLLQPFWL